jgi:hypothetical protein
MLKIVTKRNVLIFFTVVVLIIVFSFEKEGQVNLIDPQGTKTGQDLTHLENSSRAFYMGFTPFPYDITKETIDYTYQFLSEHTDIIAHHFDSGVPWPEAYNNQEYHQKVQENIKTRIQHKTSSQETYLALTPLNGNRTNIAGYWAERENQSHHENWKNISFTDPRTITAYINFCDTMIRKFEPKYFAYGIEVNMLADTNPDQFPYFVEFTKQVYGTLKTIHPDLPIFLTFQIDYYYGNLKTQKKAVEDLLPFTDILAVSTYPFIRYQDPSLIPFDYLTSFADLAHEKPFAVAETGFPSDSTSINESITVIGTSEWQRDYAELLFTQCQSLQAEFMIWFCPVDYDATWNALIEYGIDPIYKIWIDTGVLDEKLKEKPVLELWDRWLQNENNRIEKTIQNETQYPLFTISPIKPEFISNISPLGALSPPSHVFPTDHIYFYITRSEGADRPHNVSVYAPGDLIITSVRASEHVKVGLIDYSLFLESLDFPEISIMFIHISSLNQELFRDLSDHQKWNFDSEYSTGNEIYRTWSKHCNIEMNAGDIIGTTGGNPGQWALDLGVYDENYLPEKIANIDRWKNFRYLHSVCPLSYYDEGQVRDTLFNLVPGMNQTGDKKPCGSVLQDLPGTVQGCWFHEGVTDTYPEDPHLALVYSNLNSSQPVFSVGNSIQGINSGKYEFPPEKTGQINREFQDITPDDRIYGYYVNILEETIIITMPNPSTLWIEVLNGSVEPESWAFTENKTIFVR